MAPRASVPRASSHAQGPALLLPHSMAAAQGHMPRLRCGYAGGTALGSRGCAPPCPQPGLPGPHSPTRPLQQGDQPAQGACVHTCHPINSCVLRGKFPAECNATPGRGSLLEPSKQQTNHQLASGAVRTDPHRDPGGPFPLALTPAPPRREHSPGRCPCWPTADRPPATAVPTAH